MDLNHNEILTDIIESDDKKKNLINIRMIQRNGKKCNTSISGVSMSIEELKSLTSTWKKTFACNGTIQKDEQNQNIILLTGNQIENVCNYLVNNNICPISQIRIY
jgi:translation initiation factor 1